MTHRKILQTSEVSAPSRANVGPDGREYARGEREGRTAEYALGLGLEGGQGFCMSRRQSQITMQPPDSPIEVGAGQVGVNQAAWRHCQEQQVKRVEPVLPGNEASSEDWDGLGMAYPRWRAIPSG